jgi:hypothetical protein
VDILTKFLNPEIFRLVIQGPLGILAMMILVLAALAALFFKKAPVRTRVVIFVLIFGGVVAFTMASVRPPPRDADSGRATATPTTSLPKVVDPGPNIDF